MPCFTGAAPDTCRIQPLIKVMNAKVTFFHHTFETRLHVDQPSFQTIIIGIAIRISVLIFIFLHCLFRIFPVELTHAIGTCSHAIAAADTSFKIYQNGSILGSIGCTHRTDFLAGGILAVLAMNGRKYSLPFSGGVRWRPLPGVNTRFHQLPAGWALCCLQATTHERQPIHFSRSMTIPLLIPLSSSRQPDIHSRPWLVSICRGQNRFHEAV